MKKPFIIAGPCSAETEEQTIATCEALAATGRVDMLRAGVWKPRTKPGSFEGNGIKALPWLAEAKRRTGLPVSTEVANAKHVDEASAFDVDMFWIGARTTSSPFSMQELAEALRGTDRWVYVKNPLNSDIELWVGAVERLAACGVKNIGLIHRGFSGYGAGALRNAPMWHLALEIRRRLPDLPMLCDPSHICGNRAYIADISQQAADLDFDGLIVESHLSPEAAWSDASQQLTPADLKAMLEGIVWRENGSQSVAYQNALDELRGRIDRLDSEIYKLLAERMNAAEQIGRIKRDNNVMILQSARWNDIVENVLSLSSKLGLSEEFLHTLLDAIHIESINRQNRVMREKK
ncbi:MAG: 3-deoxy-7-phosphoheptulonate synthase [Rikenellaceae bacterium]|nr:3-deoxy-7-phosphoheptulonate synthase [Rikenellaceae bacterium]